MKAMAEVFDPFEEHGLLGQARSATRTGRETRRKSSSIPSGGPSRREVRRVSDVLIGDGTAIHDALRKESAAVARGRPAVRLAQPRLKPTLTPDDAADQEAHGQADDAVDEVHGRITRSARRLAKAGEPLDTRRSTCFGWNTPRR